MRRLVGATCEWTWSWAMGVAAGICITTGWWASRFLRLSKGSTAASCAVPLLWIPRTGLPMGWTTKIGITLTTGCGTSGCWRPRFTVVRAEMVGTRSLCPTARRCNSCAGLRPCGSDLRRALAEKSGLKSISIMLLLPLPRPHASHAPKL